MALTSKKTTTMKLTSSLLLSLTFILSSCKSKESEVTPAEPAEKTEAEVKAEPQKEAPTAAIKEAPQAEPIPAEPTPEPTPEPQPAPAPLAKPKKMTVAEIAADIENNPKAAAKKIADLQNELAEVLESIVDKDTADQALFDLDPIVDDLKILGQAMAGVTQQPDEELKAELQKIATAPQGRLQSAIMQAAPVFMSEPSLTAKLQETMKKLGQARKAGQ